MIGGQLNYIEMLRSINVNNCEAYNTEGLGIVQILQDGGPGHSQIPQVGLRYHIANGRLKQVLPEFTIDTMPVNLLYAKRRNLSRRIRIFMDWLTEVVADYLKC